MAPLPPLTFAQPVEPSADCCHWIVPVCPVTLTVVEIPEHIGLVAAVAVPPTDVGLTVTCLAPVAHVAVPHVGLPPGVTKQAYVVLEAIPEAGV